MKNKLILYFLAALIVTSPAYGQVILTNTTLSSAVTTGSVQVFPLTSATGVTAPSPTNPNLATFLVVDSEVVSVSYVNGTLINVVRGVNGTAGRPHASGAVVFVLPAYLAKQFTNMPVSGACTRGNILALPIITVTAGLATFTDCLGGQYVNSAPTQTTRASFYRLESPTIGAVSNAAAIGINSTVVAAELYCTEIRLPTSKLLTGLAPHIGTTGGTDKWIVALYDSGGNLIANSALAGATVGSGNAWQAEAFTAPYYAVGPGQYYGCVMSNGTTATLDTVTTGKDDNILTFKSGSAGTFGTLPSFTAPTAFASVSGPYQYAY